MKPLTLVVTPTRNRRFNEMVGLVLLLAALLLLLALASYSPRDPSLDTAGAQGIHNWAGRIGASTSDILLQLEGAAAFTFPLLLGILGLCWLRSRAAAAPWVKLSGVALCILAAPAAFALVPGNLHLFGAIPIAGVAGTLLFDALAAYVNFPGAAVLILFTLAVALYLLTSFSFTGVRQWLLVHIAPVARFRDRWAIRRGNRAQRKAARRMAKKEARQQALADRALLEAEESERFSGLGDAIHGSQQPLFTPENAHASADYEDESAPLTRRGGGFAELEETCRPIASGWDDEAFGPLTLDEVQAEALAEEQTLTALPRPQLVPFPAQAASAGAPPAQSITFAQRADAELHSVTMKARSVNGFESVYKLPPTTLLHRSEEAVAVREEALRLEAQVLIEKCAEFDVGGSVTQINPGPVVTTFEFRPEAGVKYSRITGLAEDLCLAMAAESILIERMAGKSTVGIQVPNAERETIWLRDIIEAETFAHSRSKITMAMGKDINGRIVVADLATMPHVLIAGSTGSGKSVAINAMIMSVLFRATPEQVRLILVDPKRVELGMYEGIPHLFTPIITEPKLAANALKNAVREMERRLKLLASRSVRNIDQYNKLFTDTLGLFDDQGVEEKPLPYIMIIIDELADLMILDKSNVEEAITRLAQMARAVGIHLILATQRPSVDVITGLIKANVPTRISFRLATKIDSRTILDSNGAESLLGRGDMLFLPPGTSRVQRVHAPFVTETETAAVVQFWKAQGDAQYAEGFLDAPKDANGRDLESDGAEPINENDPMFDDAVRLVFEFGKASTSLLQRRMRIGYGRAAALIDMMERDGLVGPPEGSKPRELLKPASWLNESDEALR